MAKKRALYTVTTNWIATGLDGVVYNGKTEYTVHKSQIEAAKERQAYWLFETKADKNPQIVSVTVVQDQR